MQQNLQIQLDALRALRSFLLQFKGEMNNKATEFYSILRAIRDSGLPAQVANKYEVDFADPNLQNLRCLIGNIEQLDLPYVNSLIADFEDLLAKTGSM